MQAALPGRRKNFLHGFSKILPKSDIISDFIIYDDRTINGRSDGITVEIHNFNDDETPSAADSERRINITAAKAVTQYEKTFFTVFFNLITHKYIWQNNIFYYGDKMKNRQTHFSDFVKEFDFPEDLVKDGYHVELFNDTVVVDGCKNVAEYGDGYIKLSTGSRLIGIFGDNLTIKSFACSQVIVSGRILSVELE